MPFPKRITDALVQYDKEKGTEYRIFGDQSAIVVLRQLSEEKQTDLYEIYRCFITTELPMNGTASHEVYRAFLETYAIERYVLNDQEEQFLSNLKSHVSNLEEIFTLLFKTGFMGFLLSKSDTKTAWDLLQTAEEHDLLQLFSTLYSTQLLKGADRDKNLDLLKNACFHSVVEYEDDGGNLGGYERFMGISVRPADFFKCFSLILMIVKEAELLTGQRAQEHWKLLMQHANYVSTFVKSLTLLQVSGLLAGDQGQTNFEILIQHPYDVSMLAQCLSKLHEGGLLAGDQGQANFKLLMQYPHKTYSFAKGLSELQTSSLLMGSQGQINFKLLIQHAESASRLAEGLSKLSASGLLEGDQGQANFELLIQHAESASQLAEGLSELHTAGLLTGNQGPANRQLLLRYATSNTHSLIQIVHLYLRGLHKGEQLHLYHRFIPALLSEEQIAEISAVAAHDKGGPLIARSMLFWRLGHSDLLSQTELLKLSWFQSLPSGAFDIPSLKRTLCPHAILFYRIDFKGEEYLPRDAKRLVEEYEEDRKLFKPMQ